MKLLYLTLLNPKPTAEGEERIKKAIKKDKRHNDDDEAVRGSAGWFRSLGITPPEDLEEDDEDEIDEYGYMNLPINEIEYDFQDLVLNLDEFSGCEENIVIGSQLYTKSGEIFHIEETPEQIFYYIRVISMPWYKKSWEWVKAKIKKFNKN